MAVEQEIVQDMAEMFGRQDIKRLAAQAWLGIDVHEAERLRDGMNRIAASVAAFVEADLDGDADAGARGGGMARVGAATCMSGGGGMCADDGACVDDGDRSGGGVAAVRPDGLREDVPTRGVEPEILKEQSPSAGGDGFTIPLMIEG